MVDKEELYNKIDLLHVNAIKGLTYDRKQRFIQTLPCWW